MSRRPDSYYKEREYSPYGEIRLGKKKDPKAPAMIEVTSLFEECSGIYFLVLDIPKDGIFEYVYIGQSVLIPERIASHWRARLSRNGMYFNKIFYIPVPRDMLTFMESGFIKALKPRHNWAQTNHKGKIKRNLAELRL